MKLYIILSLALLAFLQLSTAAPAADAVAAANPEAEPTFILGLLAGAAAANRAGHRRGGYYYGREGGWRYG
jgi:hypothetical protein